MKLEQVIVVLLLLLLVHNKAPVAATSFVHKLCQRQEMGPHSFEGAEAFLKGKALIHIYVYMCVCVFRTTVLNYQLANIGMRHQLPYYTYNTHTRTL